MPSPFSNAPRKQESGAVVITDAQLMCEACYFETPVGIYFPSKQLLKWSCEKCGRVNKVNNMEIDLDE